MSTVQTEKGKREIWTDTYSIMAYTLPGNDPRLHSARNHVWEMVFVHLVFSGRTHQLAPLHVGWEDLQK